MLVISHRFGNLKNGIDIFFGLGNAVTRENFIYGKTIKSNEIKQSNIDIPLETWGSGIYFAISTASKTIYKNFKH